MDRINDKNLSIEREGYFTFEDFSSTVTVAQSPTPLYSLLHPVPSGRSSSVIPIFFNPSLTESASANCFVFLASFRT